MSWRRSGFTTSPSHVPEKRDGDEQKKQRTIPTEVISTTSPKERQNEVFLGVHSTFSGPQNQPPTNDMAGVEKEPGPAHRGIGLAPSAVRTVSEAIKSSPVHTQTSTGTWQWMGETNVTSPWPFSTTLDPLLQVQKKCRGSWARWGTNTEINLYPRFPKAVAVPGHSSL